MKSSTTESNITVISYSTKLSKNATVVDTTSRSTNWSRDLSPFYLGPIDLYDEFVAENVENAWQFSKVYSAHVDQNNDPTDAYWKWARSGWSDHYAHRYPMEHGMIPLYSYWNGKKLSYIEARKQIYIPLYARAVSRTAAFERLKTIAADGEVYLRDFDGYRHKDLMMSYQDVIECESRKMGHAFVLAMMLDGVIDANGQLIMADKDNI